VRRRGHATSLPRPESPSSFASGASQLEQGATSKGTARLPRKTAHVCDELPAHELPAHELWQNELPNRQRLLCRNEVDWRWAYLAWLGSPVAASSPGHSCLVLYLARWSHRLGVPGTAHWLDPSPPNQPSRGPRVEGSKPLSATPGRTEDRGPEPLQGV
jgi:hypothetical protein